MIWDHPPHFFDYVMIGFSMIVIVLAIPFFLPLWLIGRITVWADAKLNSIKSNWS